MENLLNSLKGLENLEKSKILQRFFKTNVGQYGYGDVFLGITVPKIRLTAKEYYKKINLTELQKLIESPYHEIRLSALELLLFQYYDKNNTDKGQFIDFYLKNTKYINNWDLVDLSCYKLLGDYIFKYLANDFTILEKLSKSKDLWEKRISIVTTLYFVRKNILFGEIITLLDKNITEEHDLLQKANGWVLREIGKKDKIFLHSFIEKNISRIRKTTLNYAIEKCTPEEKEYFRNLKKYST